MPTSLENDDLDFPLISEKDYDAGLIPNEPVVFIEGYDGRIHRLMSFMDGRKLIAPPAPGLKIERLSKIKFDVSEFLPNKISKETLNQIVAFFRAVMDNPSTKGAEALVQIWLNPDKQVFIRVPEQVVSAGHLSFKNDAKEMNELIMAGNTQVGDIHSHNTMDAFFSGTDDANDAKKIGIAGVVGKITPSSYSIKWRFCFGFNNGWTDLTTADVVETPEVVVPTFPGEWKDRVHGDSIGFSSGYGYRGSYHDRDWQGQTTKGDSGWQTGKALQTRGKTRESFGLEVIYGPSFVGKTA